MKVSKAIEILQTEQKCLAFKGATDRLSAIKLGIDALIFYRKLNASNTGEIQGNFIGETPEEEAGSDKTRLRPAPVTSQKSALC